MSSAGGNTGTDNPGTGGSEGDSGSDDNDIENDNSGWFSNIINYLSNIISEIGNLSHEIGLSVTEGLSSFFSSIGDSLSNIWNSIKNLPSDIISLLGDLLKYLFVPEDNYFSDMTDNFSTAINNKVPYLDYINKLQSVSESVTQSQDINTSVDLNNYYISDSLSISKSKWIDFSIFNQYRETWFTWVRVIVYILLIIYNINEVIKLFRGSGAVSGSAINISNKASSNK